MGIQPPRGINAERVSFADPLHAEPMSRQYPVLRHEGNQAPHIGLEMRLTAHETREIIVEYKVVRSDLQGMNKRGAVLVY